MVHGGGGLGARDGVCHGGGGLGARAWVCSRVLAHEVDDQLGIDDQGRWSRDGLRQQGQKDPKKVISGIQVAVGVVVCVLKVKLLDAEHLVVEKPLSYAWEGWLEWGPECVRLGLGLAVCIETTTPLKPSISQSGSHVQQGYHGPNG